MDVRGCVSQIHSLAERYKELIVSIVFRRGRWPCTMCLGLRYRGDNIPFAMILQPKALVYPIEADVVRVGNVEFNKEAARTSIWLCGHISDQLCELRDTNCQVFDPSEFAVSAALCQAFVSGAIRARLPNATMRRDAYDQDEEMCHLRKMIISPPNITHANLDKVDFNYRGPLKNLALGAGERGDSPVGTNRL